MHGACLTCACVHVHVNAHARARASTCTFVRVHVRVRVRVRVRVSVSVRARVDGNLLVAMCHLQLAAGDLGHDGCGQGVAQQLVHVLLHR